MEPEGTEDEAPGRTTVGLRAAASWSWSDVGLLLELPLLAAMAWLAPPRLWALYSGARSSLDTVVHPRRSRGLARRTDLVDIDEAASASGPILVRNNQATSHENKLQTLRSIVFSSWRPPITTEGFGHLDEALAGGKGAILWVADFAFHRLVLKMAFHDAGHEVSHLSGPRHGWSSTLLGNRTVNRIPLAVETRFLRERVVMSDLALPTAHRVVAAMRTLRHRLRDNGVVSVSALTSDWGPEHVGFFRGRVRLAVGPPSLSYASGAPLLPVFAVREPDGAFRVIVEAPLAVDTSQDRQTAVRGAVEAYVALLKGYVARYPSQWLGWRFLEPADPTGAASPPVPGPDTRPDPR